MDGTDVGATTKGHDELFICFPLTLSFTLNCLAMGCVVRALVESAGEKNPLR